jgi:hypothetical protein
MTSQLLLLIKTTSLSFCLSGVQWPDEFRIFHIISLILSISVAKREINSNLNQSFKFFRYTFKSFLIDFTY